MSEYVEFTKEMKKDYTILAPNMLPIHFKLILQVFKNRGYKMELLTTSGREIVETGLKYVHNDTCYPAILVIGQFIHALQSGKYDPHKNSAADISNRRRLPCKQLYLTAQKKRLKKRRS